MTQNEQRANWIKDRLNAMLEPSFLVIHDDSYKHAGHEGARGGASHFTLEIWSSQFKDKPLIECHRLIYDALQSAIPHEIHALKIKITKPV